MPAVHPFGLIELIPLALGGLDLTLIVGALAVLLVVVAGWVFFAVVADTFKNISVWGSHPFGFLAGLLKAAMDKLGGTLMQYLDPIGHFFYGLAMMIWRPLYIIGATIEGLVTQIRGVSQSSQSTAAADRAAEQNDIEAVNADIGRNVAALNAEIANVQAAESADLARNVAALNDEITNVDASLTQAIQANVSGLENIINERVTTLQGQIADTTNELLGDLDANTAGLEGNINNVQTVLEGQIANGVATAENFATGLVSGLGVGALTTTLTALQGQTNKIQTAVDDCLEPLCDTVTPNAGRLGNLGNLFKGLEDLAVEAVILALAAEAIHDPGAVVADISGTVGAVGGAVLQGYRDLVGV
jgi:hypothetical protein